MKRDFLKNLGIEDDLITRIMAENGKDIEAAKGDADAQKQQLASRDTEIQGLKEQLAQRDSDIKALRESGADADAVKKQLTELQTKYKTDTDTLNQKLTAQAMEFATQTATDKFFANVKFSSELAKKAAISEFREKALKLENGSFVGGKEWLDDLKKRAKDAFQPDDPKPDNKPAPTYPRFGGDPTPKTPEGGADKLFGFNFTPVRPVPGGNPK